MVHDGGERAVIDGGHGLVSRFRIGEEGEEGEEEEGEEEGDGGL